MLTRFFGKSKPVNYLLVGLFMALFFLVHALISGKLFETATDFLKQLALLVVFVFSMLLADFIARKNDLSRKNTYVIFFFAGFCTMFPDVFMRPNVLLAHFFILLALRRIISLKTKKDTQKKIFDAALWISVASCFDFWAVAFVIILYINIVFEAGDNFKNYFIPFVGFAAVTMLANVFALIFQNAFYLPLDWVGTTGFNFSYYNALAVLVPLSFILTLTFWMIGSFFSKINQHSKKRVYSTRLMLLTMAVALVILVVSPHKNGSEMAYLAFPLAVFTSNFIEFPKEKIFKETLMWVFLFLPFVVLFL